MNRPQPRYKKGQRIAGRYLVHQALVGGMGEVYLCLDEQPPIEPIALKTFQGGSPDLVDIFKKEVENWIALEKHPNIVRCFWMQQLDNIPFMGLEWVANEEGKDADLRSWLRSGPLNLTLALKFIIDIVRGLQHAQQKLPGIIHRDLKPDNVLVNQGRQAKITDFGLATVAQIANLEIAADDEIAVGQSRYVGNIVGTPAYMAPEQWRGENVKMLDFRTDLYAVGNILYELLTGQRPYEGRTVSELRAQHLEAPLPALDGNFPPAVQDIIATCLAKRREDRYERIEILLDELSQLYEAHSGEHLKPINTVAFTAVDYTNRGNTLKALGRREEALRDFDQAIALDPALAPTYYNRGNTLADMGRREEALRDYDQAIALDPTYALVYSNRGTTLDALGRRKEALRDYDQAITLDPADALAYSNRGAALAALERHEEALRDYDQAITLDPADALAYSNRGATLAALERYEEALIDFNHAITLNPTNALTYYNRGNILADLERREEALRDYDQAIALDPADAKVYSNRGLTLAELERREEALRDYDQAITLDPTLAAPYMNLGVLYANAGRLEQALPYFDRAATLGHVTAAQYAAQARQDLRQAFAGPQPDEQEQVIRQLVGLYLQGGEAGLRTFLQQNNVSAEQINEVVTVIKQILGT